MRTNKERIGWAVLGCVLFGATKTLAAVPSLNEALDARARGDFPRAIALLQEDIEHRGRDRTVLLELAMTYAWAGRWNEALRGYDEVLRADAADREALLGRARVLSWSGEHRASEAIYRGLLGRSPRDPEALLGLGDDSRGRLQAREARGYYEQVLRLRPGDQGALEGLKALEALQRWQTDVTLGASRTQGGPWKPQGNARVEFLAHDKLSYFAAYRFDAASTAGSAGAPWFGAVGDWIHGAEGGGKYRVTPSVDLAMGPRITVVPTNGWVGPWVEVGVRARPWMVVFVSMAPAMSTQGQGAHLGQGGVQVLGPPDTWVLVQAFRYDDTQGAWATSLVGTAQAGWGARLRCKAGGGYTWYSQGQHAVLLGEGSVRATAATEVVMHAERFLGALERSVATFGARVAF